MYIFPEDLIPELIESYRCTGHYLNDLGEAIQDDGCEMYYSEHLNEIVDALDKYGISFIEDLYSHIINNKQYKK